MKILLRKFSDGEIGSGTEGITISRSGVTIVGEKDIMIDDMMGKDYLQNPANYIVDFEKGEIRKT